MSSLDSLLNYFGDLSDKNSFSGYDPYDFMKCSITFLKKGKWIPFVSNQLLKRLPINIRPLIGIRKGINPKGMGLLLNAFSQLLEKEYSKKYLLAAKSIISWLEKNRSCDAQGAAWGYNFDWPSQNGVLEAYKPSVVVTAFVGAGIHQYYEITKDESAKKVLLSTKDFILKDLSHYHLGNGMFFSYTQKSKGFCYNASLLGAELLARIYSITRDDSMLEMIKMAVDSVIKQQKADGHWNYSLNLSTGREKKQIDFHQGFVLCSINTICRLTGFNDIVYRDSLEKGARYYRTKQFYNNGQSKWRIPKKWPVEIHNQAQGIITFSQLSYLEPTYLDFAQTIAEWTTRNMQDKQGFFYYRKYKWFTNKIPFMRWSQAWMLLALVTLQNSLNDVKKKR